MRGAVTTTRSNHQKAVRAAKVILAIATVVAIASQGAQVVAAPLLLPILGYVARRARSLGRWAWAFLGGILAGQAAWIIAYGWWGAGPKTLAAGIVALVVAFAAVGGRPSRARLPLGTP